MNSHVRHFSNTLVLSVVVGKLMGGALGMALVDTTHRYAGVTPHLSPGPSPWLRHAAPADGAYAGSYKAHTAIHGGPSTSLVAWVGTSCGWQPRLIMLQP